MGSKKGGANLAEGLSHHSTFGGRGNDTTAKPNDEGNGRAMKRPEVSVGKRGLKMKGRGC